MLWIAAGKNNADVVSLMLEYGADIHEDHNRALFNAAAAGHSEMILLLLKAGWDSSVCRQEELAAAEGEHCDVVWLALGVEVAQNQPGMLRLAK